MCMRMCILRVAKVGLSNTAKEIMDAGKYGYIHIYMYVCMYVHVCNVRSMYARAYCSMWMQVRGCTIHLYTIGVYAWVSE